jgi:ATP-grasp domain
MEELIAALDARGLKSFVLTSLPEPKHVPKRLHELGDKAYRVLATESHVLTRDDVEECLTSLQQAGEEVACCVSVWEGYRHLMAHVNAQLGVHDLSEKQILELRDKLALRNRLADAGLTQVRATELTRKSLRSHQIDGGSYFIKPLRGIASYGAFPLSASTSWADIERIVSDARADTVYASIFGDGLSFLIEDYLPGREYSFEIIVFDGEARVVAIHEKCEVTETTGTVLENCCISPPRSVSQQECSAGIGWVTSLLSQVGAYWGCFHVEARHHQSRWDLIEINPRVGGSLISPSVKALNGQWSLLDLWLDSLLCASNGNLEEATAFRKRLEEVSFAHDGSSPVKNTTFFRVFFAEQGTIKRVGLNSKIPTKPIVVNILLESGITIESTSREVFIGQLLWQLGPDLRDEDISDLILFSKDAIEIEYERRL